MSTNPGFLPIDTVPLPIPGLPDQADLDPRLTRTHYFDGRLLTASDLTRDQSYLDQRLRELGQALGSGVVRGLEASLRAGVIRVSPGVAVSAAGRVMELKEGLLVDLGERALIAAQNAGQFLRLPRGLYALVMTYAEEGRGVAEVFPQDLGAARTLESNVFAEGVQLSLISLPLTPPQADPLWLRAGLMRSLIDGALATSLVPEDGVALGVVAIRDDRPEWLDQSLLRHPVRTAPGPGDLQADLSRQYEALLADVLAQRGGIGGDFAAADYFRLLPPAGHLPKGAIDPVTGRQGYFPKGYRVWAAPIRRADLELTWRESLRLPAIDLASEEPVDLVVLAPLSGQDYGRLAPALERLPQTGQIKPLMAHLDLLALRLYPVAPVHEIPTDRAAWQAIWDRIGDQDPVYVRRPTRAAETGLSGILLARGTSVPEPGEESEPSVVDGGGLVLDADALFLSRLSLTRLGALRPASTPVGTAAQQALSAELGDDAGAVLATAEVLALVERRFDGLLWQTLLRVARLGAGRLPAFRDRLAERLATTPTATAIVQLATELPLANPLLQSWRDLAAAEAPA